MSQDIRAAIEKHTGLTLPESVVRVTQAAFRVYGFDAEDICVFASDVRTDALYRLGVDAHGLSIA